MANDRTYREGMDMVPGHTAAGRLMNRFHGNARAAWDSLGIFDLETADEYLGDPARAAVNRSERERRIDGVIEVAQMFALTAVLADRERRREDEEHQTRVTSSGDESDIDEDKPIPF